MSYKHWIYSNKLYDIPFCPIESDLTCEQNRLFTREFTCRIHMKQPGAG